MAARAIGAVPGGQAEVGEDLGDHGGIFDGGDELQGAAVLRALLDVDLMETLNAAIGKTIVMVTHDPSAASRAHRIRHLDKGVLSDGEG